MATQEDLELNADDCAICWEKMESARKLPCGHLFHNSCLRSWLEQDSSCPTCRTTLSESNEGRNAGPPGATANIADAIVAPPNPATTNHFFHFDGSRYVSWLPSFSVEVTHTNLLPGQQAHATQTSQLDNMAREVQVVFPNIPQSVIMEDLRQTRSVDLTIDNILEGRVTAPPLPITAGHQRNDSHGSLSGLSTTSEVLFGTEIDSSRQGNPLQTNSEPLGLDLSKTRTHQTPESGPSSTALGGRFSKSASERMTMLESRKHVMLEQARKKYQDKLSSASTSSIDNEFEWDSNLSDDADKSLDSESSSFSQSNGVDMDDEQSKRRAVLLKATQRRLGSPVD